MRDAASPTAQPRNDQRSPALKPGDVCAGCIVWLPPKFNHEDPVLCNRHGCCGGAALDDGGYNHPVVVIEIKQKQNSRQLGDLICTVACATSFNDTPLSFYREQRRRRPHHRESIPILDSNSSSFEIDSQTIKHLVLEKGKLRKQSYVRLDHTYEVSVSRLTQYHKGRCRAYKMRLSEESYFKLTEELGLIPGIYEETDTLFETEARRLAALGDSAQLSQNATLLRQTIDNAPKIGFLVYQSPVYQPPVYQSSSARPSQPTPPIARYGSTSFTPSHRYIPSRCPDTPPYSNSSESSDPDSSSFLLVCILGVAAVGSFVWWRYSR
ncbi:hypothetical protein N431DRAFT_500434 [Stipitochalara longipes BDJ]|nr:hypothetical protein N431DRAFT_500434 [Stipitochalara longipes BDJ]